MSTGHLMLHDVSLPVVVVFFTVEELGVARLERPKKVPVATWHRAGTRCRFLRALKAFWLQKACWLSVQGSVRTQFKCMELVSK